TRPVANFIEEATAQAFVADHNYPLGHLTELIDKVQAALEQGDDR
ncbi:unnamed protein product, partial [marine sediment metagenome]